MKNTRIRINKAGVIRDNEVLRAKLADLERQHDRLEKKYLGEIDTNILLKDSVTNLTESRNRAQNHSRKLATILEQMGNSIKFPQPIGGGVGYIHRTSTTADKVVGKWCIHEGSLTFIALDEGGCDLVRVSFNAALRFKAICSINRNEPVFPIVMPCLKH